MNRYYRQIYLLTIKHSRRYIFLQFTNNTSKLDEYNVRLELFTIICNHNKWTSLNNTFTSLQNTCTSLQDAYTSLHNTRTSLKIQRN